MRIRRIGTLLVAAVISAACGNVTTEGEGGSRTDFVRCESTAECDQGACIAGECDPAIVPDQSAAAMSGRGCESGDDCGPAECDTLLGICVADCRDPSRSCAPPFVCMKKDSGYQCEVPEAPPACDGTPDGQAVPFMTGNEDGTGPALHWSASVGCIEVTYSPDMADAAEQIERAVLEWNDVACSELCLATPREEARPPDYRRGEARVHFMGGTFPEPEALMGTTVTWVWDTGRIINSVVSVTFDGVARSQLKVGNYLKEVGHAVGLSNTESRPSVMAIATPEEGELESLTALDREALCRLYGSEPYCM